MAKTIATIGGTALIPGVSRNRRLYSREAIAGAVARAQERINGSGLPLTMLTHHGAEDSSDRIVGRVSSMSLGEDGSAKFTADIADTAHGRTIASLLDTSDGKPAFLTGVSIRGAWTGPVKKVAGPDGKPAESGSGIELFGLDYTASPGVPGAGVDTFSWASGGQQETTERVLITESVEAAVTFTEDTEAAEGTESAPAVPEGLREALGALLPPEAAHVLENGLCVTCGVGEARSKTPYGDVAYADPGYQKDGVKRYPLDTTAHIRSAWSYFSVAKNAAKYTAAQAKRIKGRIKAAMSRIGAKVSAESGGWLFSEPFQVTESVAEFYGDPSKAGSWCINACNGPVSLTMSCYSMDPADLKACLSAAAAAAASSLAALDPDMDGDVDVPAGGSGDTDDDGGHETAPDEETPATETASPAEAGGGSPAPAGTEESEVPAMPEDTATTTEAGGTAPAGLTLEQVQEVTAKAVSEAVTAALAADREARKARKAAKAATETAPPANPAPAAPVAETEDARIARIVAEAIKATAPAAPEPVTETEDQKITRIVQEMVASGGISPGRKGSDPAAGGTPAPGGEVALNEHGLPSGWPNKPLHQFTPDEIGEYCAPVVDEMIFGHRMHNGHPAQVLTVKS